MKKTISIMLVLALCFSLCACGNAGELEKYKKYISLINYLEEGDYESALAEIAKIKEGGYTDNTGDNSEEEKAIAIEITMDNWQTYFEIVERVEVKKNQFDEIDDVYKTHYLVLKDAYKLSGNDTKIAVEYNYLKEWRYVEIDKNAGTVTIGELVPDRTNENKTVTGEMATIYNKETSLEGGRTWSEGMRVVKSNFEIVRLQGTLYIAE